jgi:hypothetical protein
MQTATHCAEIETPNEPQVDNDRLITGEEVRRLAGGISDMPLWRWLQRGIAPAPLVIKRRRYWWRSAVIASLTRAGRGETEEQ